MYGDLPHPDEVNSNETLPLFTETTAYAPSSPYSASKASSDHLVRAWKRTYGLPTIVTNCSNNYGPYHFPEKLIPLVILNSLEGKALPIYGKGDQIRDWLYVEDHARALYTVVTEGKAGETYNIGGHNEKKNIDVVFTICDLLDEIVPKGNLTASKLLMLPIVRDTIAVMRLMLRRLVANWDGNHRKRLRVGFVKRWNGTCPIQNGLIM